MSQRGSRDLISDSRRNSLASGRSPERPEGPMSVKSERDRERDHDRRDNYDRRRSTRDVDEKKDYRSSRRDREDDRPWRRSRSPHSPRRDRSRERRERSPRRDRSRERKDRSTRRDRSEDRKDRSPRRDRKRERKDNSPRRDRSRDRRDRDRDTDRRHSPRRDRSREHRSLREREDRHSSHCFPSERSLRPSTDRSSRRESKNDRAAVAPHKKAAGPLPDQALAFQQVKDPNSTALKGPDAEPIIEKQQPNFAPTGLLAAATNTIEKSDGTTVVLKYHEPAEARAPPAKDKWRLFVFKGPEILEEIDLWKKTSWLIGRDVGVVDIPAENPSVSKQHAVLQFRWVEKRNEFGDRIGKVKLYLIDLESANGTFLNGERVEESRFVEVIDKDLIKFGESQREYVVMLPPRD